MSDYVINHDDVRIETIGHPPHPNWTGQLPRGVRITHLPTGLVAECDKHRTQHKNRAACLEELRERL